MFSMPYLIDQDKKVQSTIKLSYLSVITLSSDWLLIFEINMFEHVSMPYLINQDKKVQSTIKRSHDRVITLSSDWLLIFEIKHV